jgi:L-threonylcarbamoyladenylate synthase
LSKNGNLHEVGAKLYATLHELDKKRYNFILVDTCSEEGIGQAIMDRLRRAARNKEREDT